MLAVRSRATSAMMALFTFTFTHYHLHLHYRPSIQQAPRLALPLTTQQHQVVDDGFVAHVDHKHGAVGIVSEF